MSENLTDRYRPEQRYQPYAPHQPIGQYQPQPYGQPYPPGPPALAEAFRGPADRVKPLKAEMGGYLPELSDVRMPGIR